MNAEPSLTVVTPSYNQASFIEPTIQSVRAQSYDDISHIVIDGESDDGTLDILRRHDDAVDWISEPDEGQADALNKGFNRADGDIIGWLNADDPYVYRDAVADVVDAFDATGADMLYGHAVTIDSDGVLRRVHHLPRFDAARLRRHCFIIQPSVFLRSAVLDDHRLNPQRSYSMDYELWLDIADDHDIERFDGIVAADRNHADRKIIADAAASVADTAALRTQRGIGGGRAFRARQLIDGARTRARRLRGLRGLAELYRADSDEFAFDLGRASLLRAIRSQLLGDKKEL